MLAQDPIAPVILGVTVILVCGLVGRYVARQLGQPAVLGELAIGLVIGNVGYLFGLDLILILREGAEVFDFVGQALVCNESVAAAQNEIECNLAPNIIDLLHGPNGFVYVQVAHVVDVFSRYGVIFLLFLIGLDTTVNKLREVGGSSLRVAFIGILVPFLLGFGAIRIVSPELSIHTDLFVAATLGATSIGITARVLRDLGQSESKTAQVILGASVLDDILGLVMLSVVSGIVVSGSVVMSSVLLTITLAVAFLACAFWLSPYFLRVTVSLVRRLELVEAKIFVSLIFVMSLAWLASAVGLATIVGAFAAGVILHDAHFKHWGDVEMHQFSIKDLISPLEVILVPIFFILMGIQVKAESFFDPSVIAMTSALLGAAIAGKLVSGLGADKNSNRWAVGIGMLPRGEVGLVFASIGKSLGVIDDALFAAIVFMVIVTTMVTPVALKRVMSPAKA